MKKLTILLTLIILYTGLKAQKVDSIYFNLYTDSLKKGFYNYINIDGKFADGTWQPLDTSAITLVSNTGFFKGNDLFIDSAYNGDKVKIKAILRNNPRIWKEVIIYIRKRGFDEPLKTDDEIIDEMMRSNQRKKRTDRNA